MDSYRIIYTPIFEAQLKTIINYILYQLCNPYAANRLLDLIETKTKNLISFPYIYPIVKDQPWHDYGIRMIFMNLFVVYYCVDDINKTVSLLLIIYAKRDQLAQLSKLDF